jgi:hypothetical protein
MLLVLLSYGRLFALLLDARGDWLDWMNAQAAVELKIADFVREYRRPTSGTSNS